MEHCVLLLLIIIRFEIATRSWSVCVFSNSHLQSYLHSEWIISRIDVRSNRVSNTEHNTHAFLRLDFLILQCQSRTKINGYYKLRNVPSPTSPTCFYLFLCFSCSEDKNSWWHFPPFLTRCFPRDRGPLQPLRSRQRRRDVQMQQKPLLLERNTITTLERGRPQGRSLILNLHWNNNERNAATLFLHAGSFLLQANMQAVISGIKTVAVQSGKSVIMQ